jgi:hypothetical protein
MMDDEQDYEGEWTRHQLHLPTDDFDEDDELDERIARAARKKRDHVDKGNGLFGTT